MTRPPDKSRVPLIEQTRRLNNELGFVSARKPSAKGISRHNRCVASFKDGRRWFVLRNSPVVKFFPVANTVLLHDHDWKTHTTCRAFCDGLKELCDIDAYCTITQNGYSLSLAKHGRLCPDVWFIGSACLRIFSRPGSEFRVTLSPQSSQSTLRLNSKPVRRVRIL